MFLTVFTLAHVAISLVGIVVGALVVYGFVTANRMDTATAVFLTSTLATSVTGFGFPVDRVLPAHIVGLVSLVVLSIAMFARYRRHLAGTWRPVYVLAAVAALYLNVFVAIVQAFLKIPLLRAVAPTQAEPPFQIAQLGALVLAVALAVVGARRFKPGVAQGRRREPAQSFSH